MYDKTSVKSIVSFAKKLKNQSLREACASEIEKHNYKGKGNFGQILEKFYFGIEPNSRPEADFNEVGLELKSSPLKILKNGEYRSKERLVLNIINYLDVSKETFENSTFWKKNAHLLLVFYLHNREVDLLDYVVKLIDDWEYPATDLSIIKSDWQKITAKINAGKAHELSEGDTLYLGACTKGSTAAKSLRDQPFNPIKAKQRAYSLKQGYVNHIIASIAQEEQGSYGKIIKELAFTKEQSLEKLITSKFEPFYGNEPSEIEQILGVSLNSNSKSYLASLSKIILGIQLDQKIEEFEKAEIKIKTIRLKENFLPKESISFPAFKYEKLIQQDWDDSDFKKRLEQKFFFVFYKIEGVELKLEKVFFWNMPYADIEEAKLVWNKTIALIKKGRIVKKVLASGVRQSFFPKKIENKISHVRPHATNRKDTYPLPFPDKLTNAEEYTKHSFWVNDTYIRDEIFLK